MDEKTFETVFDILRDKFRFDSFDLIEFTMEYEKQSGEKIPDEWLSLPAGRMETVIIK